MRDGAGRAAAHLRSGCHPRQLPAAVSCTCAQSTVRGRDLTLPYRSGFVVVWGGILFKKELSDLGRPRQMREGGSLGLHPTGATHPCYDHVGWIGGRAAAEGVAFSTPSRLFCARLLPAPPPAAIARRSPDVVTQITRAECAPSESLRVAAGEGTPRLGIWHIFPLGKDGAKQRETGLSIPISKSNRTRGPFECVGGETNEGHWDAKINTASLFLSPSTG